MAQETANADEKSVAEITQLNKLVDVMERKQLALDELRKSVPANGAIPVDVQLEVSAINSDMQSLRDTFELLVVGDMDNALFKTPESTPFDWKVELMLVLEPVLDSLQSITEKPRQMTNLRTTIALNERRLSVAAQAIDSLALLLPSTNYEEDTREKIIELQDKWINQKEFSEQRLLAANAQLQRLSKADEAAQLGVIPVLKKFILGRGLTLLLAVMAAVVTWVVIRGFWWLFSQYAVTKDQRRGSIWYRLLSYSFYLVTIVFCIVAVLAVLYIREDLLLLALALVMLAIAALGIRKYIPSYVREARLLLNLGAVREGERVMYDGLPWQIMSVNLQTVLWNPSLEGIVRLPLEIIDTLTSRPVKDKNWFPTSKGDYVLLPDSTFALVLSQTPELVELRVRGGMIQWIRTADWYAMSITNLSIGDTYGVAVTFGFDYSLQAISLTEIPKSLHEAVTQALNEGGYKNDIANVLVELTSASASSIDYLIFVTIKSTKASQYFALERLIQQTCVAVANEKHWNIPFQQMMIHHQAV